MTMTEETDGKKQGRGQGLLYTIGLIVILGLLVFAAPRLNSLLTPEKPEDAPAAESQPQVVAGEEPCADWIPLVEKQLQADEDSSYKVLHVRLSDDHTKLLIDMEITTDEDKERVDFILERDEFGRYISDNDAMPMKLYPPATLAPPAEPAKHQSKDHGDCPDERSEV